MEEKRKANIISAFSKIIDWLKVNSKTENKGNIDMKSNPHFYIDKSHIHKFTDEESTFNKYTESKLPYTFDKERDLNERKNDKLPKSLE